MPLEIGGVYQTLDGESYVKITKIDYALNEAFGPSYFDSVKDALQSNREDGCGWNLGGRWLGDTSDDSMSIDPSRNFNPDMVDSKERVEEKSLWVL